MRGFGGRPHQSGRMQRHLRQLGLVTLNHDAVTTALFLCSGTSTFDDAFASGVAGYPCLLPKRKVVQTESRASVGRVLVSIEHVNVHREVFLGSPACP